MEVRSSQTLTNASHVILQPAKNLSASVVPPRCLPLIPNLIAGAFLSLCASQQISILPSPSRLRSFAIAAVVPESGTGQPEKPIDF
jgi:hypothetical protein